MSNIGAYWADSWVWTSSELGGSAALFHNRVPQRNLHHTVPLHHWPAPSSSLALLFMKSVSILKLLSQSKFSYQFWSSLNLALKLHWKSCVCAEFRSHRRLSQKNVCRLFVRIVRTATQEHGNVNGKIGNGRILQCGTRRLKFELQTFAGQQLEKVLGQQNKLNLLPTMLEASVVPFDWIWPVQH